MSTDTDALGRLLARPAPGPLRGDFRVPGDKSISHRSLMFSAIASGESRIAGLLEGEDCLATLSALRALGVPIVREGDGAYRVAGVGLHGLAAPAGPLDLGNSGTGMRLFCGLLAGQQFATTLVGDASLSVRPMRRVTMPLQSMGARIEDVDGHAPIRIEPADGLRGIDYDMPVASAQVKSALLIAGLYARGETRVREPGVSRDHSERMLAAMGAPVERGEGHCAIRAAESLRPLALEVPGDLSSAAFFLVAGSIVAGSELTLRGVGVNPTRRGVLDILIDMGAAIRCTSERELQGEPVADLHVSGAALSAVAVGPDRVPLAIDEFPVLFVAAAVASGTSVFEGLAELRHKESDRIATMVRGLRSLGVEVNEGDDWVRITGGSLHGGQIDSLGDHRIAMAFAVAASRADAPVLISDTDNIVTSFPGFEAVATRAGLVVAAAD